MHDPLCPVATSATTTLLNRYGTLPFVPERMLSMTPLMVHLGPPEQFRTRSGASIPSLGMEPLRSAFGGAWRALKTVDYPAPSSQQFAIEEHL
jgi:hypothetical protein